ncbi:MAG: methylaspartate mutase subunit S [Candidatus Thorarchaeota archaeon]
MMKKQSTIITGTVGWDAHIIGTKILSRTLKDAGFNVVELGIKTPPEDFIKAAQETNADAIMMSSMYGMAEFDLKGFKLNCIEAGIGDTLLYIGGMLAVGKVDFEEVKRKFKDMGFDRVYPQEVDLEMVIIELKKDLNKRIQRRSCR